jgi:hypothetical protein
VQQMIVVDRALVQAVMQYFLRQPLGDVLPMYQLLNQALANADRPAPEKLAVVGGKKDAKPATSPEPEKPAE